MDLDVDHQENIEQDEVEGFLGDTVMIDGDGDIDKEGDVRMDDEDAPIQQDVIMAVEVPALGFDNGIDLETFATQKDAVSSVEVSTPTPVIVIDIETVPIQENAVSSVEVPPVTGIDIEAGRSQQELVIATEIPTPTPAPPSVPNTLDTL